MKFVVDFVSHVFRKSGCTDISLLIRNEMIFGSKQNDLPGE